LKANRLNARTLLLLLVEALLLFSGMVVAVYVRLGEVDGEAILIERGGFYKIALVTVFCLASFYLFDLYDFVVMHDRRELVLRLLQALGLAWVALALTFYAVPQVMIGRGVSLISLPIALALMVGWRVAIHWLLGHPELGERILIVGSGPIAIEIARETLERPDTGYRVVGFADSDPELLGKSLINPKVIGLTSELGALVRRENIDRLVVAHRRSTRSISHPGTFAIESFRRRFDRRKRGLLRASDWSRPARHGAAIMADLFQSWPARAHKRRRAQHHASHGGVFRRLAFTSNSDRHRDFDQSGFAWAGALQTGTRRQERTPIYADEISLDARRRREGWTRLGQE